jgi:hypothetical protein
MGELSGAGISDVQGEKMAADHAVNTPKSNGEGGTVKGVPTDVDGVFADGERNGIPVFDVSPEEFYNNMKMDRKRLRFSNDSNATKYMKSTKYSRPFWIRNTKDGFLRKIK